MAEADIEQELTSWSRKRLKKRASNERFRPSLSFGAGTEATAVDRETAAPGRVTSTGVQRPTL